MGRRGKLQQQQPQQQQKKVWDDGWEAIIRNLAVELCPGCGAYGHMLAIYPTQYEEEELQVGGARASSAQMGEAQVSSAPRGEERVSNAKRGGARVSGAQMGEARASSAHKGGAEHQKSSRELCPPPSTKGDYLLCPPPPA
ncbi:UNVERIFIED_CONTAM: hypothetical protein FKN15_055494 [Acipenser sinensis]